MKKINHIYKSACLFGLLAVGLASCEDYLTIYPTDRVVEENFWEDMNDLNGVRYGAYKQMASTVENMFYWGDLRSDSYKLNTETHSEQDSHDRLSNILAGMPDSSMNCYDWGGVYKTINLCNKVLKHGPEVLERDKQFTTTEWIYMRAEMTALRALNYFYLIRAFKDVPYTTKVINSDREVETFPLSNQLEILDSLILDCESVAGQARNRFASNADTKGMITNAAIYAMLADMYLWRGSLHEGRAIKFDTVRVVKADGTVDSIAHTPVGDYDLAAKWADKALESHHNQVEDYFASMTFGGTATEVVSYGLPNVDLIKNNFTGAHQSTNPTIKSQNEIIGNGNSIESILELQYSVNDDVNLKNNIVNNFYGYSTRSNLMVAEDAMKEACEKDEKLQKFDTRLWVGCQVYINDTQAKSGYYCLKYQTPRFQLEGQGTNRKIKYATIGGGTDYNNWIIYRTTDVMLMKAEALACAKKETPTVKSIMNAINRRSYCDIEEGKQPAEDGSGTIGDVKVATDWSGKKATTPKIPGLVKTVMNQRQLEFIGEGKRWFDLVRCAERYSNNNQDSPDERENPEGVQKGEPGYVGNGMSGMSAVVECFMQNSVSNSYSTLINRFKNRWGLYSPIYEQEVKASRGVILQNPVWNKSRYEQ
jgi:hypothetical protein